MDDENQAMHLESDDSESSDNVESDEDILTVMLIQIIFLIIK